MPSRIPDDTRAAVLDDILSPEELSTRAIADRHGVSESTVRAIAKENGIENAFTRANTESATRARVADMASRRTALAAGLLDDAERLRTRAWSAYPMTVSTAAGVETVRLELPPLGEVRNAYAALGISVDKHLALVKHDADPGTEAARSLLTGLGEALQLAAGQLSDPDDVDDDEPASGNAAPQP
jgi:hypothetical protein